MLSLAANEMSQKEVNAQSSKAVVQIGQGAGGYRGGRAAAEKSRHHAADEWLNKKGRTPIAGIPSLESRGMPLYTRDNKEWIIENGTGQARGRNQMDGHQIEIKVLKGKAHHGSQAKGRKQAPHALL